MRLLPATLGQVCSAHSKHGPRILLQYTCLQQTHVVLSELLSVEGDSPVLHHHHLEGGEGGKGGREGREGGEGGKGGREGGRDQKKEILVVEVALVVATYRPLSSSSRRSNLTPV